MGRNTPIIETSPATSHRMSRVRTRNTDPEIRVRRCLHKLGYRFRLHRRSLPGQPDIVLPRFRTVIFVHGCFWHQHVDCKRSRLPKSRQAYWKSKLENNAKRDVENATKLTDLGWNAVIVWECETRPETKLNALLLEYLVH